MNRFIEWLCIHCGELDTRHGFKREPPIHCGKPMYFNGYKFTPNVVSVEEKHPTLPPDLNESLEHGR